MSNKMSVATATVATVHAYLFYIRYSHINLSLEGSWGASVIDLTQTNVRYASAWMVHCQTDNTHDTTKAKWHGTIRQEITQLR